MKLKNVRYLGMFFEMDGQLGWMPIYKAIICRTFGYKASKELGIKWIPQNEVNFS